MKVLIVEDDKDLCQIYEAAFRKQNCDVVIKNDGLNAIAEITQIAPDFVLLDLMIPELDGYSFLEALQDNTSVKVSIIIASNLSSDKDIKRALDLGAIGYLKKVDYTGAQIAQASIDIYRKSLL